MTNFGKISVKQIFILLNLSGIHKAMQLQIKEEKKLLQL